MKKVTIALFIAGLLACTEDGPTHYDVERVVINNSGYDISLWTYLKSTGNTNIEIVEITDGEQFSENGFILEGPFGNNGSDYDRKMTVDSVIVEFSGLRRAKHCFGDSPIGCVDKDRRIILGNKPNLGEEDRGGYVETIIEEGGSDFSDLLIYTYTVTPEDFENAAVISN